MTPADIMIDLPTWLDIVVTGIWYAMAFITGILIHRVGNTIERYLRLAGWSILAVTWTVRLLLAASNAVAAHRQLREWALDVRCFRNNQLQCHRADRVAMELRRRHGK